jgi:hypothetical protein
MFIASVILFAVLVTLISTVTFYQKKIARIETRLNNEIAKTDAAAFKAGCEAGWAVGYKFMRDKALEVMKNEINNREK